MPRRPLGDNSGNWVIFERADAGIVPLRQDSRTAGDGDFADALRLEVDVRDPTSRRAGWHTVRARCAAVRVGAAGRPSRLDLRDSRPAPGR